MTTEIRVPTLGESVTEATVATWFKAPGDSVAVDEMLCELETDKVTVEVPSSVAGTLAEIIAAEGSTVGVDALLAVISDGASAAAAASKPAASAPEAPVSEQPPAATGSLDVLVPTLGGSLPLHLFSDVLAAPTVIVPIANHDDNQHAPDENLRLANLWYGIDLMASLLTMPSKPPR